MPPAANRSGIWKGIAAAAMGLLCIAGGWWLGQLQNGADNTDQARLSLERQASALQQQLNLGQASPADSSGYWSFWSACIASLRPRFCSNGWPISNPKSGP